MGTLVDPDDFDRVVKLLVDAGDADTFPAAEALLRTYRLQIVADVAACSDPAWQAAILTAANAGARAMHGGVTAVLAADPVCSVPLACGTTLSEALVRHGATVVPDAIAGPPTIVFGDQVGPPLRAVRPFAGQWVAGVVPADQLRPIRTSASVPAAVLAVAMALSECFGRLRGHAVATDRAFGVSLWRPGAVWDEAGAEGPEIIELPATAALLGLGHLGQAFAWLLGVLPYPLVGNRALVLIDDDRLSRANRATSMLDSFGAIGMHKPRVVAAALEPLGWDAALVERRYVGGSLHASGDPTVLLAGVDNPNARRMLDDTGFPVIFDAGLGAGPDGFLGITVRRLPASRPSHEVWPADAGGHAHRGADGAAYAALAQETGDRCGVEMLAGRTVATAFVGVAAACWTIGSLLRELHGGERYELVDVDLRDPGAVTAVASAEQRPPRIATVAYASSGVQGII